MVPALPPPEPPKPPVTPGITPATKPRSWTDFIASVIAAVGGIAAQKGGMVGLPVGDGSTLAGLMTTVIPFASMLITGLSGSNVLGNMAGGALDWFIARRQKKAA